MKRSSLLLPLLFGLFFCIGGFLRYSQTVRSVDAVGLFASGAVTGIAVLRVVEALRGRRARQLPD